VKIAKATSRYEAWLGRHLHLLPADLELKHREMRSSPFAFLRATFYRWAQTWKEVCGKAAKAPRVLAVGDLHVENFGTWRDVEGRLVWGINDFDEAFPLPYTNDLIRLSTSVLFSELATEGKAGIAAVLQGYSNALEAGGRPWVLAEHHAALRAMAVARLHEPERFWQKLQGLPDLTERPPVGAMRALERMMPERGLQWRLKHRVAGLGSLARERYLAVADYHGGLVAREAKAIAPSACVWASDGKASGPIHYQEILNRSVRCRDPFVRLQKRWIVRRLAPDCSRIELAALPKERDEMRLLEAMGWETANVHLGSAKAATLQADLAKRPRNWLFTAAEQMREAVLKDFEEWASREQP
jgi:hypothetical protein